uniref:BZIP domain-containing protein n=1 Tax=Steinernema glaseri TaxID=37863 RepID=A0A1I8AAQ7_9BILA
APTSVTPAKIPRPADDAPSTPTTQVAATLSSISLTDDASNAMDRPEKKRISLEGMSEEDKKEHRRKQKCLWRERNREQALQQAAEWRAKNRDQMNATQNARRAEDRENFNATQNARRAEDRDKFNATQKSQRSQNRADFNHKQSQRRMTQRLSTGATERSTRCAKTVHPGFGCASSAANHIV